MNNKILPRERDLQREQALLNAGASTLQARLFASRGVQNSQELHHKLNQLLHFNTLKNSQEAGAMIAQAILEQKKMCIIADYDADGATACSVALLGLRAMGAKVDFIVPSRFTHGYGLTAPLADIAYEQGANFLITVDNGISAHEGVLRAKELGMQVLVTDHHLSAKTLPECLIVNPNQPQCTFASKSMAGVGVMFYVLLALRQELRQRRFFTPQRPEPKLDQLLDLVALGTVADVVRLDHNNRILVSQGLARIRHGMAHAGIQALFQVAKKDITYATTFDLGFAIAPRINSAGRLDDMSLGIQCLTSQTLNEALPLATQLSELNTQRRHIEQNMLTQAESIITQGITPNQHSICLYRDDFHQGVTGIVAGRLREQFYRPSFVFAPTDNADEWRGSGRSINGFHLRDALDTLDKTYPNMIIRFGGHAMAAGLSIKGEALSTFSQAFETLCQQTIDLYLLQRIHQTDGSLDDHDTTLETAKTLQYSIWGQGFDPPTFDDIFEVVWQKTVGNHHCKAGLRKNQQVFEAMIFRQEATLPPKIHAVYRIIANRWQNNEELQLYIDYWESA